MKLPTIVKNTALFGGAGILWALGAGIVYYIGRTDGTDHMMDTFINLVDDLSLEDSEGNEVEFRPAPEE